MTYRDPTGPEILIIAIALIVPLVYAFTRHGRARMLTLMFWVPWWLFVARVIYLHPATRPGWDVRWALLALVGDPMTIVWPLFVLFVYGLIRLFTRTARREKPPDPELEHVVWAQHVVSQPSSGQPNPADRPASVVPTKRCLGCGRTLLAQTRQCPHCHYTFASAPKPPTGGNDAIPPPSSPRGNWCPQCGAATADANYCARCGRALASPSRIGTRPETV